MDNIMVLSGNIKSFIRVISKFSLINFDIFEKGVINQKILLNSLTMRSCLSCNI